MLLTFQSVLALFFGLRHLLYEIHRLVFFSLPFVADDFGDGILWLGGGVFRLTLLSCRRSRLLRLFYR